MRKAQKVERFGLWPSPVRISLGSLEPHQLRFLRMDLQPVLGEACLQCFKHLLGISFFRKSHHEVSSPRESHPQALSEPDVNLSAHPAPIIQSKVIFPTANEQTAQVHDEQVGQANIRLVDDAVETFCICDAPSERVYRSGNVTQHTVRSCSTFRNTESSLE